MKTGNPTESIPKQQGEEGGFYLIWLVPRRLLGEKVRSQGVLFRGFLKVARVMLETGRIVVLTFVYLNYWVFFSFR